MAIDLLMRDSCVNRKVSHIGNIIHAPLQLNLHPLLHPE